VTATELQSKVPNVSYYRVSLSKRLSGACFCFHVTKRIPQCQQIIHREKLHFSFSTANYNKIRMRQNM
jgi:hypothetical protein